MSKIETGGPAFPGKAYSGLPNEGLSLRDYFAAQALPALISESHRLSKQEIKGHTVAEAVAITAYAFSDAMLEARK